MICPRNLFLSPADELFLIDEVIALKREAQWYRLGILGLTEAK